MSHHSCWARIGGSYLGVEFVYEALKTDPEAANEYDVRWEKYSPEVSRLAHAKYDAWKTIPLPFAALDNFSGASWYSPSKLTWQWKINHLNLSKKVTVQLVMFVFGCQLQECIDSLKLTPWSLRQTLLPRETFWDHGMMRHKVSDGSQMMSRLWFPRCLSFYPPISCGDDSTSEHMFNGGGSNSNWTMFLFASGSVVSQNRNHP